MRKVLIIACTTLLLASCTTVKKTATTTDVTNYIHQYPTIANVEVKEKVEEITTWSWNPFKRDKFELRKGNLVAETLKKYDADILLEPHFIITKQGYGDRSITLIGFPVKYKSFHAATPADLKAIEVTKGFNKTFKYNEDGGLLKSIFGK